jgi:hypothetical protein
VSILAIQFRRPRLLRWRHGREPFSIAARRITAAGTQAFDFRPRIVGAALGLTAGAAVGLLLIGPGDWNSTILLGIGGLVVGWVLGILYGRAPD